MFVDKLLQQFKLNPAVRSVVVKWAEKMAEMLIFGLPKDQWSTEVYQLYSYCQRNKSAQFSSFDPLGQFSAFMEEWRSEIIAEHQTSDDDSITEHPSLTDLLLDNLNLNLSCDADLQILEKNLIHQIKAGTKLEYSVAQVRSFCRSHAAEKGFYDERGRLNYLVGVWYDIVAESYLPISPVNLRLEDENTFDDLMHDINQYVGMQA